MSSSKLKNKNLERAQKLLLRALFAAHGGSTKATVKVQEAQLFENFHPQNFVNWRNRGKVPLAYVPKLAKLFKCSEYALNFDDVTKQQGAGVSWADAVASCRALPDEVRERLVRTARGAGGSAGE